MYKQIIIIRKDLNMRKGKMIAQGSHARRQAIFQQGTFTEDSFILKKDNRFWYWLTNNFKKIVVSVNSEAELLEYYELAKSKNILCSLIKDSGLTEFKGVPTYTAVAIGPDLDNVVDEITKSLPLL